MKKQYVHNLNEVRALVRESFSHGNEEDYQGTQWLTHQGEKICNTEIRLTEFDLIMPDFSSLTVEV